MPKRQSGNKKSKQSNFAKLSIFQPNKYKFKKTCPLSIKGAPQVDFKNIKEFKLIPNLNLLSNLNSFQQGSHEWLGLVSYYLMGRTDKVF